MYSFTEEEFSEQIRASKSDGVPTTELQDMLEEIIMVKSYEKGHEKLSGPERLEMVYSSANDFESGGLLERMVEQTKLDLGHVFDFYQDSIGCTFARYKAKLAREKAGE